MPAANTGSQMWVWELTKNYIYSTSSLSNFFNIAGTQRIKALNNAGLVMWNSFKMPIIGIGAANERADVTTQVSVSSANSSTKSFIINKELYKDYAIDKSADLSAQTLIRSGDYINGIITEIVNKANAYIYQTLLVNAHTNANTNITPTVFDQVLIASYKTKLKKTKARVKDSSIVLSSLDANKLSSIPAFTNTTSIFATKIINTGSEIHTFNLNGLKALVFDYDKVLEWILPSWVASVDAILNNDGLAVFAGYNSVLGAVDTVKISTEDMQGTNGKSKLLFWSALAGFGVWLAQAFTQEIL